MNTCGRLDEHAKERKSFTKQAYAPGLKGPGPLGRIDFGNPALKPMLRMMADNMKKDTRAYHPPEGLRLRSLSVDNGNGRQIWCFVMEPEDTFFIPAGVSYQLVNFEAKPVKVVFAITEL